MGLFRGRADRNSLISSLSCITNATMISGTEQMKGSEINHSNLKLIVIVFCLIAAGIISIPATMAQGNLILLKKRIVFEGQRNTEILEYGNIGEDTATYVVSLIHLRMNEDGTVEKITAPDSGELFADDYVRYFPHSMVIAPKESQTMKIQLVNTENLRPGEYRSYLYFRAKAKNSEIIEKAPDIPGNVSVSLTPEFGIAIPVIIRMGTPAVTAQITDLSLEKQSDSSRSLRFSIRREGNFSVYGHITVTHIAANGKKTEVAKVQGVAVYAPGQLRRCMMVLKNQPKIDYHTGKLLVSYTKPEEEESQILAESFLNLDGH